MEDVPLTLEQLRYHVANCGQAQILPNGNAGHFLVDEVVRLYDGFMFPTHNRRFNQI